MLQASDFGFDDEGEESEREPSALSRESSLDCITISPKPRPGPPREFLAARGEEDLLAADPPRVVEQTAAEDGVEKASVCEHLCNEDDDSDCEDRCLFQVRDRRIELDLELIKRHQRPETSSLNGHDRERLKSKSCNAVVVVDEGAEAEREDEVKDQARIAADLGLLRKHGGAHSVAIAAAPLRKRMPTTGSEDKSEDKARRKAEKKAAKEAARLAGSAPELGLEPEPEPKEDQERIAADLALVQHRRPKRQHDRKTSKAGREAATGMEGLKEAPVPA
jgi:hypothetical protein